MRSRLLTVVGLLTLAAGLLLGTARAVKPPHGPNLWAGTWTTSTGRLGLRLMDSRDLAVAKSETRRRDLFDRLRCHGPQYYRGGYVSGSDTGKVIGCGTPRHLTGRYLSDNRAIGGGSFDISNNAKTPIIVDNTPPLTFAGNFTPDTVAGKKRTRTRWTGSWQDDFIGDGCCALAVIASSSRVELGQTVTLRARPASGTTFTFEIKRAREQSWYRLAKGVADTFRLAARIPGHFDVRATTVVGGRREVSATQQLEVQFPGYDAIVADAGVKSFTRAAWEDSLTLATPQGLVREEGFFIVLDTCNGRYSHTARKLGDEYVPAPPPAERPGVELGSRPADRPGVLPLGCGTYAVAEFHTHPGTTYTNLSKGVGPSSEDDHNANVRDVPGLVYDYIESTPLSGEIPDHWPLHSPARLYHAGQNRRKTPP